MLALCAVAPARAVENPAWPSYGYDNQLRNAIASKALTLQSVRRLGLAWSRALDGPLFASPLAAQVGGAPVVFAATEKGSVYAVAAGSGAVLWRRELGVVETAQCGTWGITSTGAIDLERGLLYVASAHGEVHALSLATGAEAAGYPVRVVGDERYEYVWGGLRIAGGRLYVSVASYCDVGPADGSSFPEGRLVALPLDDPARLAQWDPVPGPDNLGGIWGWGGVSIDPLDGTVFTGVGNAHSWSEACGCYVDDDGYGDRLVALAPDLSSVVASSLPKGLPPTGDDDFGAAPLLFQPKGCPPLAAANNKIGALYVWNRRRLADGPLVTIPLGDGRAPFVGAPSWSASKQMIYDAETVVREGGKRLGNGVRAFHVEPGCGFRPIWVRPLGDGNQATPTIVGNILFATGGDTGGFFALAAANGVPLWSYPTPDGTVAAIVSAGGSVFGADTGGRLYAFRPTPPRRRG